MNYVAIALLAAASIPKFSLVCSTPIMVGQYSTCTVTLERAAPKGGIAINVATSPAYFVPKTVMVPEKSMKLTFTIYADPALFK